MSEYRHKYYKKPDHNKMNRLRREFEEVKKENEFLKKTAAFFAKEIG